MSTDAEMPLTRSSRDPDQLRERLFVWLHSVLPEDAEPEVSAVSVPANNGMSSETLLFDASWTEGGQRVSAELVARVAPDLSDVPIFPTYDLELQFEVIRLVGAHSHVPVPRVLWLEPGEQALGAPFFVMERVEGRVPPDVMPYNMDSWLLEADLADQMELQQRSVRVLADLHSIDLEGVDISFLELDVPGDTPLRRHFEHQREYYEWMRGDRHFPVIEDAFAWLEERWPEDEGDTVICWGDARIGNIIFDGFTPVAILDWEMATVGPRGIDLGWMAFLHTFFEHVAQQFEMEGMPHFLRLDDLATTYEALTGVEVADLDWYEVYAALRHAIVMARIHARRVYFGEAEWPENLDEAVMHGQVLRRMVEGSYTR